MPEKSPRESAVVRAAWYYRRQNSLDDPRPECQHCHQCAKRGSERKLLLLLTTRSLLPPCEMKVHKENSCSGCCEPAIAAAHRAIGSVCSYSVPCGLCWPLPQSSRHRSAGLGLLTNQEVTAPPWRCETDPSQHADGRSHIHQSCH